MSVTIPKIDLTVEDFALRGLILSKCNLVQREGKQDLVFVTFVGSKMFGTSPNMFYFGDLSIEQLASLRGKKVDVLLGSSQQGFNVQIVQPS